MILRTIEQCINITVFLYYVQRFFLRTIVQYVFYFFMQILLIH